MIKRLLPLKYGHFFLALVISLFIGIFYLRPAITGYVIEQNSMEYRVEVNKTFLNSGTYAFDIGDKGILTSLKLSGEAIGNGNVKVYLVKDSINYTLLDSKILKEKGIAAITSFVVKEDGEKDKNKNETTSNESAEQISQTLQNETTLILPINETLNLAPAENETINITEPVINKSIKINLQYKQDSIYDEDNDGIENINEAVDLTVENTQFNWDADESKLCTIWEAYSINEYKATTLCYGSSECCSLINLAPSRDSWNGAFYSLYGKDGVGLSNIISARIIYADYSLNADNPYSNIIYSEWSNLSTAYNYEKIIFKDICKETCFLDGFNESSYTIMVDVENAALALNEIIYSFLPKIEKYKLKVKVNGKDEIEKISAYQYDHLV
ncbi:MAG: hypothetical protein AABX34_05980, partial [Nanoarchaeota archaeon]